MAEILLMFISRYDLAEILLMFISQYDLAVILLKCISRYDLAEILLRLNHNQSINQSINISLLKIYCETIVKKHRFIN